MITSRATLDVASDSLRQLTLWLREHQVRIGTPKGSRPNLVPRFHPDGADVRRSAPGPPRRVKQAAGDADPEPS